MRFPVFQIDAFASEVFAGNPAVVCCLDTWLADTTLRAIAVEHNISTTAFLVDQGERIEIRYVTPAGEFPLVGHASLAAAYVVFARLRAGQSMTTLHRRDGPLAVSQSPDGRFAIELPAVPAPVCPAPAGLAAALGVPVGEVRANASQYFVTLADEAAVAAVAPNMEALMCLDRDAVIVTAPGRRADFVSRAFAPKEGLPEDPVCGSSHLSLVPYWSERLGRTEHRALQLSARGGELDCTLDNGQVRLAGQCALYMEGTIHVAESAARSAIPRRAN